MNFEKLMGHMPNSEAVPLLRKWNAAISAEGREIVDTLIERAYLKGKVDAAAELQELTSSVLSRSPAQSALEVVTTIEDNLTEESAARILATAKEYARTADEEC